MKILITGFDPFGGERINPAFEVIKKLPNNIDGVEIVKLQVPTVFNKSVNITCEKINEIKPDYVLNIGQAGGRAEISIERIAINIMDARMPDNENNKPVDEIIDEGGNAAYFATIPIKALVTGIRDEGIPASISNSAGTYVCNNLMYGVLNYINKNNLNIKAGFIHIPYLLEQAAAKGSMPSMSIDTMVRAIEKAVKVIALDAK